MLLGQTNPLRGIFPLQECNWVGASPSNWPPLAGTVLVRYPALRSSWNLRITQPAEHNPSDSANQRKQGTSAVTPD